MLFRSGFHQPRPHAALARWWPTLGLAPGTRVFVPLAGKSRDLVWLAAAGYQVVGIELSALAVQQFFDENGPQPGVELRCGNLFELGVAALGPIAGVFDRASLVALPASLRRAYAATLSALSPPGTRTLLVSMEYDSSRMAGPPHSVDESEIHTLFGGTHEIELLERISAVADFPKFAQRGLTELAETCYRLVRR